MDFQSDDNFSGQYRPPARPQDEMLTASIVLSVLAIGTTCWICSTVSEKVLKMDAGVLCCIISPSWVLHPRSLPAVKRCFAGIARIMVWLDQISSFRS